MVQIAVSSPFGPSPFIDFGERIKTFGGSMASPTQSIVKDGDDTPLFIVIRFMMPLQGMSTEALKRVVNSIEGFYRVESELMMDISWQAYKPPRKVKQTSLSIPLITSRSLVRIAMSQHRFLGQGCFLNPRMQP